MKIIGSISHCHVRFPFAICRIWHDEAQFSLYDPKYSLEWQSTDYEIEIKSMIPLYMFMIQIR